MRHTRWHRIALFAVLGSALAAPAAADRTRAAGLKETNYVRTRTGTKEWGVGNLHSMGIRVSANKNSATTGRVNKLVGTSKTKQAAHDNGLVFTQAHQRTIKTKEGGTRTVEVSGSLRAARNPNLVHGNKRVQITPGAKKVRASELRAAGIEVRVSDSGKITYERMEGRFDQAKARAAGVEWVQGVKGNPNGGYFRAVAAPRSTAKSLAETLSAVAP
ncbi:MAG: hypothetical protein IT371_05615 [Deltaproteobacteria bacterium]|nr:hypothetical protein [Deltaproteobacteria bacterium]